MNKICTFITMTWMICLTLKADYSICNPTRYYIKANGDELLINDIKHYLTYKIFKDYFTQGVPQVPENIFNFQISKLSDITFWPSDEFIKNNNMALKNRVVLPENKLTISTMVSPDTALRQSKEWIVTIIKANYVPREIDSYLIPVQNENPSDSKVICRYFINDTVIQINQGISVVSVSIKMNSPDADEDNIKFINNNILNDSVRILLNNNEKIPIDSKEANIYINKNHRTKEHGWREWNMIYSYKNMITVFFPKKRYNSPEFYTGDEEWF